MVAPSHIVGKLNVAFYVDVTHETMTFATVGTNAFVAVHVFLEGKTIFCHGGFDGLQYMQIAVFAVCRRMDEDE